ncbi:hypothetical protein BsWGS_23891 [Bradybaena similaris]
MEVDREEFHSGSVKVDIDKDTSNRTDKGPSKSPNDSKEAGDDTQVTQTDHSNVDDDDEEVDISCGIWNLRTSILGKYFANLYVFAICVGIAALFTAMVSEIIQVQLPSLERQFNIDNAKAGLFDTAYKAGYLGTILLAGHFTKKAHIPVVVGLSGMAQGLMLLIPPILQFVDPYNLPDVSDSDLAEGNDNARFVCQLYEVNQTEAAESSQFQAKEVNRLAYYILIGLQTVKGVTDVFHSGFLPSLYMDDNLIDKSKMGILLGIQSLFQFLSSPLGREINGVISELPIDLKNPMSSNDHRFVSAWWLGFLIFGIGTAVFSMPVLLFPRRLVSRKKQKAAEHKTVLQFAGGHIEEEVEEVVSPGTAKEILNSDRKVSIVITAPDSDEQVPVETSSPHPYRKQSTASHGNRARRRSSTFPPLSGPTERKISLTGDIVFEQPVKSETEEDRENSPLQLLKDFPKAAYRLLRRPIILVMILDVLISSVPWAGIYFFRSTYIASEYNVPMSRVAYLSGIANAVGNTGGIIVSSLLSSRITTKVGYVLTIFVTYFIATLMTPLYLIFGCDNQPVYGAPGQIGLPINTSDYCGCENMTQLLSCGADGNNYFTPCHAGCSNYTGNVFINCSLLANHTGDNSLTPGVCKTDCELGFLIYVFVHGLQNFVTSSCTIAYKLLVLRTVEPRDRGLATTMYIFFFNILGIPAPNLFGRIVDNACLVSDGETCALYDRTIFRHFMGGVDVAIHASAQVTSLMMLCVFKFEERQAQRKAKKKDGEKPDAVADKLDDVVDKLDDVVDGNVGLEKEDSRRDSHNAITRF